MCILDPVFWDHPLVHCATMTTVGPVFWDHPLVHRTSTTTVGPVFWDHPLDCVYPVVQHYQSHACHSQLFSCCSRWKADIDNLISNNLGGEASLSPSLQPRSLRTKECVMDIQTTKVHLNRLCVVCLRTHIVTMSCTALLLWISLGVYVPSWWGLSRPDVPTTWVGTGYHGNQVNTCHANCTKGHWLWSG